MQRFVGTFAWSLALVALASCSNGSPATQGATGHGGGTAGAGGTAGTAGTGGTMAPAGSGGTTATGGNAGSGGIGGGGGQQADAAAQDAGGDTTGDTGDGDWMPLFNGRDLTGWIPAPGTAALYAVDMLNGEPVIHVYPTQPDQSNQPQATMRTTQSFSNYIYHEEYKWGTKRFADRAQKERDNGICFHICNDPNQVWPESIEFQIGSSPAAGSDWVVGDIFMLVSKTRAQWTYKNVNGLQVYSPTGTKKMIGAPISYEKGATDKQRNNNTDWNVLELTVHGSKDATYNVNGEVANGLTNMECQENGTWHPLDHGPIAVQAEFAEVYLRNLKIKVLPSGP